MGLPLNTTKILGIEKNLGSLEIGKDATLFVSDGDALDMMINRLSLAFIRGKKLDLKILPIYDFWLDILCFYPNDIKAPFLIKISLIRL